MKIWHQIHIQLIFYINVKIKCNVSKVFNLRSYRFRILIKILILVQKKRQLNYDHIIINVVITVLK